MFSLWHHSGKGRRGEGRVTDSHLKTRLSQYFYSTGVKQVLCCDRHGRLSFSRSITNIMFKRVQEAEETESPKRNIRDSGYIDCWDSERSDSLSPPRHCREDSFDSLDSFGSRSHQTPSPDVLVARGSSDGRKASTLHHALNPSKCWPCVCVYKWHHIHCAQNLLSVMSF